MDHAYMQLSEKTYFVISARSFWCMKNHLTIKVKEATCKNLTPTDKV